MQPPENKVVKSEALPWRQGNAVHKTQSNEHKIGDRFRVSEDVPRALKSNKGNLSVNVNRVNGLSNKVFRDGPSISKQLDLLNKSETLNHQNVDKRDISDGIEKMFDNSFEDTNDKAEMILHLKMNDLEEITNG